MKFIKKIQGFFFFFLPFYPDSSWELVVGPKSVNNGKKCFFFKFFDEFHKILYVFDNWA